MRRVIRLAVYPSCYPSWPLPPNRDLKTFATALETTEKLAPRVPKTRTIIAESGIASHADLERLGKVGVHAFLVGESLMREPDVALATRSLLGGRGHDG